MTNVAYCAINEETNQFFQGKKGQVAFNKIGSLKISMNQNKIDYNSPMWTFYEINSIGKTMKAVKK